LNQCWEITQSSYNLEYKSEFRIILSYMKCSRADSKNKKQSSPKEISEPEPSYYYFELEAYWGTKHMGGLKATEELIELCHINKGKYILEVGCGVGITACYIAKRYGCRVVGMDISERMIDKSKKRAKREGVEDRVKFTVADA